MIEAVKTFSLNYRMNYKPSASTISVPNNSNLASIPKYSVVASVKKLYCQMKVYQILFCLFGMYYTVKSVAEFKYTQSQTHFTFLSAISAFRPINLMDAVLMQDLSVAAME